MENPVENQAYSFGVKGKFLEEKRLIGKTRVTIKDNGDDKFELDEDLPTT